MEIDEKLEYWTTVEGKYTLQDQLEKLKEETEELLEAIIQFRNFPTDRNAAHLIEECVDVGIVLRRVEQLDQPDLAPESKTSLLWQKFYDFKMLRQEIRVMIGDPNYGGRRQEV